MTQSEILYQLIKEVINIGPQYNDEDVSIVLAHIERKYTVQLKEVSLPLEERKRNFGLKLADYEPQYGREMILKFFNYWTEHNENGRKCRWEMQKVFNLKLRLKTWHERSNPQQQISKGRPDTSDAVNWAKQQLSGK